MTDVSNKRIHALIPDLLRISRQAGKAILDVYQSDFAVKHKEDRSPLTLADRRSHEIIAEGIARLREMQIPVLSEEGKNIPYEERRSWDLFWLYVRTWGLRVTDLMQGPVYGICTDEAKIDERLLSHFN